MRKTEVLLNTVCDSDCTFCFYKTKTRTFSRSTIDRKIRMAEKHGMDTVILSGGEVTLRDDLPDIVAFVRSRGMTVSLFSNGRNFRNLELAERITAAGIHRFLISSHAHNEALSRELTGVDGAFAETRDGIANLIALRQSVVIKTVVSTPNISSLAEIASYHIDLGVRRMELSWVRPAGRAMERAWELIPRYALAESAFSKVITVCETFGVELSLLGVPLCRMGRSVAYFGDPYLDRFALRSTSQTQHIRDWYVETRNHYLPVCTSCEARHQCHGVLKGYLAMYGPDEFSAFPGA